jgi:hypothetical protein
MPELVSAGCDKNPRRSYCDSVHKHYSDWNNKRWLPIGGTIFTEDLWQQSPTQMPAADCLHFNGSREKQKCKNSLYFWPKKIG